MPALLDAIQHPLGRLDFLLLMRMRFYPILPEEAVFVGWRQGPLPEEAIGEKISHGKIFIIHALT